jgi:hypothetical protein
MPEAVTGDVCVLGWSSLPENPYKHCPIYLATLIPYIKELPRKQSFGHIEKQLSTNYWNQIYRNEFTAANGFRTSFTVHQEYLTSHGLHIKPGL